jgi:hypothetical protein
MSKPTGKRFSDREETQKGSKDSKAVTKEGLTNKSDKLPALKSDFVKSTKSDISKALQDVDAPDKKGKPVTGAARASRIEAKSRGQSRLGGTAGYLTGAASIGYGAGRALGNMGGDELVRKGIDKSGLGKKIDKAATGDRIELSKESKARIAAGDLEKGKDERVNKKDFPTYKKDTKSADAFREKFKDAKESGKDSFKFEGREYNTKSKEMNKGGMAVAKAPMKANCGASVPPSQKAKK